MEGDPPAPPCPLVVRGLPPKPDSPPPLDELETLEPPAPVPLELAFELDFSTATFPHAAISAAEKPAAIATIHARRCMR
jgi:hypothetical protein